MKSYMVTNKTLACYKHVGTLLIRFGDVIKLNIEGFGEWDLDVNDVVEV